MEPPGDAVHAAGTVGRKQNFTGDSSVTAAGPLGFVLFFSPGDGARAFAHTWPTLAFILCFEPGTRCPAWAGIEVLLPQPPEPKPAVRGCSCWVGLGAGLQALYPGRPSLPVELTRECMCPWALLTAATDARRGQECWSQGRALVLGTEPPWKHHRTLSPAVQAASFGDALGSAD